MEILSRKLNKAVKVGGGVMPYWSSIRAMEINHILYADDILIFTNGGKTSFSNMLKVLDDFCLNSGQVLQASKCKLFMSKHISETRKEELLRISGYSCGRFPIRYLGAPLFSGQPRLIYFQSLVDAVKDRLEGWMKSFLSLAGRLIMIKSVLSSIPIHTLSALPVPKGTLDAIDKVLRSFLWSSGGSARHHWVNWDTVCLDLKAGGLGIKPLSHMMTALRGKMAWKYLCNDSLWAKHARSRFDFNGKGSHLWKNIAPFISSIALDCHWNIGNGSTPAGMFCGNIGLSCPRNLRLMPIREVLSNPTHRRSFMHNINPIVHRSLRNSFNDYGMDKLIWDKDPFGKVTTKAFMKTFVPPVSPLRKFEILWQGWLPPKVSCFLWRIMHKALPTNDNIIRLGIAMASKCSCCLSPQCESLDHLFIHGDMAGLLWSTICPIFRLPKPGSLQVFLYDWGVNVNFSNCSSLLAFGIVCLCFWEIWKVRNDRVFDEGTSRFSKSTIFRCASALAKCIPASCRPDLMSRRVCAFFRLSPPLIQKFRVFWIPWRPFPNGSTCNISIHSHESRSRVAAIIRDQFGEFTFALKATSSEKHFLKSVFFLLNELKILGQVFHCILASREEILLLGRDSVVDWELFQIKRKLVDSLGNSVIFRVSFSLNKPAEVLCFSNHDSLRISSFADLPPQVQAAISQDGLPHPCSSRHQQVFL